MRIGAIDPGVRGADFPVCRLKQGVDYQARHTTVCEKVVPGAERQFQPVPAAVHPEVVSSGGHPACRRGRASCRPEERLKRGGSVLVRTT